MTSPESPTFVPWFLVAAAAIFGIALAGCGARLTSEQRAAELSDTSALAAASESASNDAGDAIDYDPWEPVNERIFWLNHDVLDCYAVKPAARVWQRVVPRVVRSSLTNAFDNLGMPERFVNNLLQGRFEGASREVVRLVLNTTVGVAGLVDVAARWVFTRAMPTPVRHSACMESVLGLTSRFLLCSLWTFATVSDTESICCLILSLISLLSLPPWDRLS